VLSDKNLKENIFPISDSSEVLKLKPVSFTMKGGKKLQFGFIAQDVEETEIGNIVYKNERGVRSIAYNQVIPLLLHQIQQLTERVAKLEAIG
jgi:hypothetical protein